MNKKELIKLVEIRRSEAEFLLNSNKFHGAYYLIGYALECALKICITHQVQQYDFPDKQLAHKSHTHDLTDLLAIAGLKQKLNEKEQADEQFKLNWASAKDWSEKSRYDCNIEQHQAHDLFDAINNEKSGVLAWLKTYW